MLGLINRPVLGICKACIGLSRRNGGVLSRRDFGATSDSTSSSAGPVSGDTTWAWVPPKQGAVDVEASSFTSTLNDSDVIPVKMRTLLSSKEIADALTKMGAIDIRQIPLTRQLDNIQEFIIASGTSTRHIRKMSGAIVQALKSRKIKKAMGYKGAEGEPNDDWLLIDCYDRVVHLMLPDTRKALNLEEHWSENSVQPNVAYSSKENEYEKGFEKLLEDHPVPDNWNTDMNTAAEGAPSTGVRSKKKTKIEYL